MRAFVVALVALAAWAPAAAAAPPWSEPEAVPGSLDFGYPAGVAMGRDGTVAVVYVRDGIQLALRRPDGEWTEPRTLSRGSFAVTSPSVVITRRRELVVTWTQAGTTSGPVRGPITVRSVAGRIGRRLGRPRRVGTSSHFNLADPQLVAGARGHVAVAWRGLRGRSEAVRVALRRPRGRFGRAEAVPDASAEHDVYYQQLAVERNGAVDVAWTSSIGPAVRYARRGADGDWGRALTLSAAPASRPRLAVAPDGTAVVAWHAAPPDSEGEGIRYGPLWATLVNGTARPARLLSNSPVHEPDVVASGGEVVVTWSAPPNLEGASPLDTSLHFAIRPLGADLGSEQVVRGLEAGAPSYAPEPRLAMTSSGAALQAFAGGAVRATLRPPGGAFGAPELISADGDFPQLAAAGGRVAALFMSTSGRQLRLSVRR